MSGFKQLGLPNWLVDSLNAMRITTPTEIQKNCIPQILKYNKNCIGGAKTGSGKTIAFAAPMLSQWSKDPSGLFGLVLTPTRELAHQIAEQFVALGANMNIRISLIVGGNSYINQNIELSSKPHFIIATPGRLAHHIINDDPQTTNLVQSLQRLKFLVLDEADFLLTETFAPDLQTIISNLPEKNKRQTLLFTATITDQVKSLSDNNSDKENKFFTYEMEQLSTNGVIPSTLSLHYIMIPEHVKEAYLYHIITSTQYIDSTIIIFCNRTHIVEMLRRTLYKLDVRVTSLHSQMPQQERTNSLHRFRANVARVLIATDVAARGLDIQQVKMVINYDIPMDPDTFIHRSGRTARAGKHGDSLSFVTPKDVDRIVAIEDRIGEKMQEFDQIYDTAVIKKSLNKVTRAKRESIMMMEKEGFGDRRANQRVKHNNNSNNSSSNQKSYRS
ncbi:ATP-dependent RNA helicase Dbp8p [Monosporozyma servazzii]